MEPTQTLHVKSPLTSPDSFKNLSKRTVKFDYRKLSPMTKGTAKVFQRRSSEKQKTVLQPLKIMMFDTDPLHLLPMTHCKTGIDSPEMLSLPIEKKISIPFHLEPLNVSDPLNLSHEDDFSNSKGNRKRKKRRNRTSSLCFDDDATESIHNQSSDLISPGQESPSKIPKFTPKSPIKIPKFTPKSPVIEKQNILNKTDLKRVKYKYGNFIHFGDKFDSDFHDTVNLLPSSRDQRIQNFKLDWFKGKKCLSVGSGDSHVIHWIHKHCQPSSITGIDIDAGLVNIAKNKIRELIDNETGRLNNFPKSIPMVHGPLSSGFKVNLNNIRKIHKDISFLNGDYVPATRQCLQSIKPEYDIIIFLSTSKWIQLNYGDDGLKRTLKKIFLQLKPGGRLLFEPQTLNCYKSSKNITVGIRRNYDNMKFTPTDFISYLLSSEVGFVQSVCLAHTRKRKTNNLRPLYLLTKAG